jgi:hypothetical protein
VGTTEPEPELPPLTVEETERIIGRIAPAVDEHHLVLIGGQAIALWRAQLAAYLPPDEHTVASRDVDFQGSREALGAVARLLEGRSRIPSFDNHTPLAGIVVFRDSDDHERQLDVLPQPHGLNGEAVAKNAPDFEIPQQGGGNLRIYVMHPVDVLRSRVANSALPNKQTERAADQLAAAIAIVPAYGRMLLDHGADPRLVTNMNEAVFRLAHDDSRAMRLYIAGKADVAAAVLDDQRLPQVHREARLPQLRAQLTTERERHAGRAHAPGPELPSPQG